MSSNTTTRRTLTVRIPAQIHYQITPNASRRYPAAAKYRLQQELKDTTIRACQGEGWHLGHDLTPPLALDYTVARGKRRQPLDAGNCIASMKYVEDGIAHVLAIDDRHFRVGNMTQIRDPEGIGWIEVTIREVKEPA